MSADLKSIKDAMLEREIDRCKQRLNSAATKNEQEEALELLCDLVMMRSPEQVRKMEQERGLR